MRQSDERLKPALSRALSVLIEKHPILSAVPVDLGGPKPRFVRLERIVVDHVLSVAEYQGNIKEAMPNGALDAILQEQHNLPFTHGTPLLPFWRLVVLENSADTSTFTVTFCFHHSLADTKSALVFLEELEYALAHPSDLQAPTVIPVSKEALLPPLESVYHLPLSATFLERQQAEPDPPEGTWSGELQAVPCKSRFASIWLSAAVNQSFQKLSKEKGTSLTAAIMSITAASFFDILPPAYTTLHGDCAVSLRRFLPYPIAASSMGCYVGSFSETYSRSSGSIWEEAGRTSKTISSIVTAAGEDMPVGYLRHVPDMTAWLNKKIGKKRWAAWELSNVGALNKSRGDTSRRCEIQSLLFSQSAGACSGAVKISGASGRDGALSLGFSWQEGIVADSVVHQLMNMVKETIQMVTSGV